MAFESFVAKRLLPRDGASRDVSRHSVVAIASIALGVLVMVTAVCILRGFQREIRQKVVGFGAHIVVQSFQSGNGETPVSADRPEVARLRNAPGVRHMQFFAQKGGMAKTDDQIHGIVFKGVDNGYDTAFFAQYLVEGRLPDIIGCRHTPQSLRDSSPSLGEQPSNQPAKDGDRPNSSPKLGEVAHRAGGVCQTSPSNEVLISSAIADKLQLGVGDKLRTYFLQGDGMAAQPSGVRARAFEICGIYKTDLTDFDEHFIIGDLRQVQRLSNWDSNMVDGYEILVDDFSRLDATADELLPLLGYDLTLNTVVQQNPALFSWLDLLDSNIVLIITIMILVCAVAILSALLIMIFEKTSAIGMLKALGATNGSVRRVFLIKAGDIVLRGLLIGNAAALLLCGLQHRFRFFRLDSASYSMDFVPVDLNPWIFILVSVGTLVLCLLTLLLPTAYISNIHPAKTIRFE